MSIRIKSYLGKFGFYARKYYLHTTGNMCFILQKIVQFPKIIKFMKKATAMMFYLAMKILGTQLPVNSEQYRLISKNVISVLSTFTYKNTYLSSLLQTFGFNSSVVYYERKSRTVGKSKFTYSRVIKLALGAIVSYGNRLFFLISILAFICFMSSCINLMCFIFTNDSTWLLICCSVWLVGAVILFCLRIASEYIGSIFYEVKNYPRYIVECVVSEAADE